MRAGERKRERWNIISTDALTIILVGKIYPLIIVMSWKCPTAMAENPWKSARREEGGYTKLSPIDRATRSGSRAAYVTRCAWSWCTGVWLVACAASSELSSLVYDCARVCWCGTTVQVYAYPCVSVRACGRGCRHTSILPLHVYSENSLTKKFISLLIFIDHRCFRGVESHYPGPWYLGRSCYPLTIHNLTFA